MPNNDTGCDGSRTLDSEMYWSIQPGHHVHYPVARTDATCLGYMYSTHIQLYEYYWGQYPVPVVLCTVVLLYLNSAERAHMYLNTCTYPDTCKHERTPVTLNVLGVEMLKILSDCKIGYECGKILSEKQDRLEGTGRLLYSGARRSRRLYLRRRQKERPGDTRILVQSVESCIDQCTRLKDPCRGLHGKLKAEAQLKQRRNNRV